MKRNVMKEYSFPELGCFTEGQCKALKESLEGGTYMNFRIKWSNYCGNCMLHIETDYDEEETTIKNLFLSYAFGRFALMRMKSDME